MQREPSPTNSANEIRQRLFSVHSFLAVVLAGRTGSLNDLQREFLITALGTLRDIESIVEVAFPSQPETEDASSPDEPHPETTPLLQHPDDLQALLTLQDC